MATPHDRFSRRHGYRSADAEITIREDAPSALRTAVLQIGVELGLRWFDLRRVVCQVLRVVPDSNNWSEEPNVRDEVVNLVQDCDWFRIYDIIEAIHADLRNRPGWAPAFEEEINGYFRESGIGWQLVHGVIQVRGAESFETVVRTAESLLDETRRTTARREIHEALADLSRRPTPDLSGAVHHAMGSLECLARDLTGDARATLGEVLKRHHDLIPRPLDTAVEKIWGYASERGRHIREGNSPTHEEAELIVGLAATVSAYLLRKVHE